MLRHLSHIRFQVVPVPRRRLELLALEHGFGSKIARAAAIALDSSSNRSWRFLNSFQSPWMSSKFWEMYGNVWKCDQCLLFRHLRQVMEEKERDQFFKQLLDHHPVRGPVDGVVFFEPLKVMLDVVHLVLTITSILLEISAWSLRNPEDQLSQVFSDFSGTCFLQSWKHFFLEQQFSSRSKQTLPAFRTKNAEPFAQRPGHVSRWLASSGPEDLGLERPGVEQSHGWRYGSLVCFLQIPSGYVKIAIENDHL